MTDIELWERKYDAVFKLMQNLADAGRILLDLYETSTEIGEEDPPWIKVLKRLAPEEVDYALTKLIKHTKEVNNRYGDPDPEGTNLNEGDEA